MGIIIFNGRSSKDFGLEVEHYPEYAFPERDYDVVHVPGRNGDLLIDKKSYKNSSKKYEIAFGDPEFEQPVMAERAIRWLCSASGYARLEDSYEPGYYRMATFRKSGSFSNILNHGGRATIEFDCKPQRFLKAGEEKKILTSGSHLINPTDQEAKPLIKVNARGYGVLTVNDYVIRISALEHILNASTGLTDVSINAQQFMQAIGSSTSNQFVFENKDFNLTASVGESTGISDASVNKSTFMTKTGCDQESSYQFIFVAKSVSITNGVSNTIETIEIKDISSLLPEFTQEGNYIMSFSGNIAESSYSSSGITAVSVDATAYYNRYQLIGKIENAYVNEVFTYNGAQDFQCWIDSLGNVVELSDYGITATGTPANNDTITVRLVAQWANQDDTYTDIFEFTGYPYSEDTVTLTVVMDHWVYYKNGVVIVETGFALSEYGVTVTGTPANGDTVTINATGVWKIGSTTKSLSTHGITTYGQAKINDSITVILGNPITIDSEIKDCYNEGYNRNQDVEFDDGYPVLSPGNNSITFTGGITSVEVTPRWWTL